MRTESAFLVSAVRKDGITQFVRVKSLAGAPCLLSTDLEGPIHLISDREVKLEDIGGSILRIGLLKEKRLFCIVVQRAKKILLFLPVRQKKV